METQLRDSLDFDPKYNFSKIGDVVKNLEVLKKNAIETGDEDIEVIVNSAFNLCFQAYYLALRSLGNDPPGKPLRI
jgi:hypothetical protein